MAAPTVYEDVATVPDPADDVQLFAGKKFWVAQRVPSRTRLLGNIEANGGEIVKLEKQADYLIADHFRKDCPPGSISYLFVEKSIQEGRLRDPLDHRAGPPLGQSREPGAVNRPAKGGRAPYTPDEDRLLHQWVRDCVANGGSESGNEIYKQLEAKYPRHTWQSWRDRYLKQLRGRPPSAFNIPDNAPPSPSSDHPPDRRPSPAPASVKKGEKASPEEKQPQNIGKLRDARKVDYTLDQLEATFSSEDWEELYAIVESIESIEGETNYDNAWGAFADMKDNQTADQWRQYYEKVVHPQWLRDPEWKRKEINTKVEARHEQDSEANQSAKEQEQGVRKDDDVEGLTAMSAPDIKEASDKAKASLIYEDLETSAKAEITKQSSETKLMSSSTAQHESPKYVAEIFHNHLKRVHEDNVLEEQEQQSHPSKRQRSTSPGVGRSAEQEVNTGTQEHPLEISSNHSMTPLSQQELDDARAQDQLRSEAEQRLDDDETLIGHGFQETQENKSVASDDFDDTNRLAPPSEDLDDPLEDDLPSDTPTPRPSRQRPNNFDTQAILSPSQNVGISRLPRPVGYTQDLQTHTGTRSSSIVPHPESEASTTQSLEEFRRLSGGEFDAEPPFSRSPSYSPAPSIASDDPDPPLEADEFDDFYSHWNGKGFTDEFISAALKRTRCRPDLAGLVLDAWKDGNPLPKQRGIWSIEEDEAAQHGDGDALVKLEKKHTLDGWGGITERILFLEGYNSR